MNNIELWKDIIGYEGIYQVSNIGNVKRISGIRGVNKKYQDNYILNPRDNGKGYLRVRLSKNGIPKMYMIHQLVAKAFIENPENKKEVNHKDCNKKNNNIYNLEWSTRAENVRHAWENGLNENARKKASITGAKTIHLIGQKTWKKVINLENGFIFDSGTEAWRQSGMNCTRRYFTSMLNGEIKNKTNYQYI